MELRQIHEKPTRTSLSIEAVLLQVEMEFAEV
jgi:hypothetical protein